MTATDFNARLEAFLAAVDGFVADYYKKQFPTLTPPTHVAENGPKYIRIVTVGPSQRSAYCFLDYTGTIWKPKGWKGPERKNPRGSIFDENFSLGKGLTQYGTSYLR